MGMGERRTVVLYGNSLLMAGLEVSLRDQPGLDVVRIDATLSNAAQRLSALQPDVVIFDLAAPNSPFSNLHFPSSILHEHPGIALIGLDLNSNKVLVLSGQQHTVLAANDLAQVIQALGG
jgi:DNA-binding NarL/FixJ family response regulator